MDTDSGQWGPGVVGGAGWRGSMGGKRGIHATLSTIKIFFKRFLSSFVWGLYPETPPLARFLHPQLIFTTLASLPTYYLLEVSLQVLWKVEFIFLPNSEEKNGKYFFNLLFSKEAQVFTKGKIKFIVNLKSSLKGEKVPAGYTCPENWTWKGGEPWYSQCCRGSGPHWGSEDKCIDHVYSGPLSGNLFPPDSLLCFIISL